MPPPYNHARWRKRGKWSGRVAREGGDITVTIVRAATCSGMARSPSTSRHRTSTRTSASSMARLEMLRHPDAGSSPGRSGPQAGSYNAVRQHQREAGAPGSLRSPVHRGRLAMNVERVVQVPRATAFSAKNSTARHSCLGYRRSAVVQRETGAVEVVWPTITPNPNILDSLKTISVGTSGVVFATSIRLRWTGRVFVSAGPYAQVVTSVALAGGSSIGFAGAADAVRPGNGYGPGLVRRRACRGRQRREGTYAYFKYIVSAGVETKSYPRY